jgi:hypothetical protein
LGLHKISNKQNKKKIALEGGRHVFKTDMSALILLEQRGYEGKNKEQLVLLTGVGVPGRIR